MKSILIADEMHPSLLGMLEAAGFAHTYRPTITRAELLETIGTFEGLLIRSKTLIDEEVLLKASRLEFIGRAGAGLDLIDVAAAERRGIRVFAANEGNRDAVGEHALGMLLSLLNHLHTADREVRQKIWRREANRGSELGGKTVGLIGYGNNGRAFAQRLSGFGVRVLAYDKFHPVDGPFAEPATMEQLFGETDVLSLHVPLSEETAGLVDADFIGRFAKPFYLINVARGEVVRLADVLVGLQSGKVLGACLDVLEFEKLHQLPAGPDAVFDALATLPNVIFSPHVAGWSHESYVKINEVLVGKIRALNSNSG
ncbi:MAG: phosphoglycerate dehydrogenase [Sphingobacteriaceae bacterium]|nr:phosphoglycerate dehydrogenase [Cytophagaceae bacterium]